MKKLQKIMIIVLSTIVGLVIIGIAIIWFNSSNTLPSLKDSEGKEIANSISEKTWMEINGIQQGMFIRSENPENPIILYLHGGPGSPEFPLIQANEKGERLEKDFTICYWEQRGAGMTYSDKTSPATMTVEQMVEDTKAVTHYLQQRFKQKKIYLMGHSWGSYLGIKTIQMYPENYLAYIGIGQVTDQLKSEQLAYEYMLQHAKDINDKSALKNLREYDPHSEAFPQHKYLIMVRSPMMNKYGIGIQHNNCSMLKLFTDIFFFKGYTLSEKIKYTKGGMFSLKYMFDNVTKDNLFVSSNEFTVPVYITHGKYDFQTSYVLSEKYLQAITAPKKEFFTFEHSAHSPNVEESEKFIQIIRNIAKENPQQ